MNNLPDNETNDILLDEIPVGITIVDEAANIRYVNRTLQSTIGQGAIGQKCFHVLKDDRKQCSNCPLKKPIALGGSHTLELEGVLGGRMVLITHTGIDFKGKRAILEVFEDVTGRKQAERALEQSIDRLQVVLKGTIQALSAVVEARDPYTAGHQQRVAQLVFAIAKAMRLSEKRIEGMHVAAAIHDIGKIYVPAELLTKPGRLTTSEFELIKAHSQIGYDILKTIEFPWPIARIVHQHHERVNGSGYPLGLSGEDILLEARIIGLADVVEAMASHRPYRPALGLAKALEEISKNRGLLYEPAVVSTCLRVFQRGDFKFA